MITLAQLRVAGLSDATVTRLVARGQLARLYPAVFALGHRVLSLEGRLRAALAHGGEGSGLSHTTAASWWELTEAYPQVIHLSVRGRPNPARNLRIHRPRRLEPVIHRGFAVTSVSRTLLDLAAIVRPTELRLALAQADYRKLLDPARLIGSLQRGQPGSAALRRALAAHLPQLADAASVLEVEFLLVCERAALPMPEVNARVGRFRVDCLWRRERLVVELDGRDAHAYPAAFERDRQRDLELRALGFDVRRYSHHQVTKRPDEVLADLGAALARERPRAHRRRR